MNELPPFVHAKAFWEGVSLLVSGALALGVYFGWFDPTWAFPSAVISGWIYGLLRMFGINPELKLREVEAKLRRAEALLQESARIRNDLLGYQKSEKPASRRK